MEPIVASSSAEPASGRVVATKYELVRRLARGSMGEVWIARHATLGGEMAIKFLSQQPSEDDEGEDTVTAMARFRFEAQVAARLSRKSRHIVAVTDHGEEFGRAYLVMELVEGESLESKMHREETLELPLVAKVVSQIAKGLTQAHGEGVFHRDLKPANVLLAKDEDGEIVAKILDFGIAKAAKRHVVAPVEGASQPRDRNDVGHETEKGIVLGTPNYMSPEQARGLASLDHRCDVWALGVIAYEALTGRLPYDGETTADLLVNICTTRNTPVRVHRKELPEALDPLFAKAFAARVGDRFQDAVSFVEAFAKIVRADGKPLPGTTRSASIPPANGPSALEVRSVPISAPPRAPAAERSSASAATSPRAASSGIDSRVHDTPFASEQDILPKRSRAPLYAIAALLLAGLGVGLVMLLSKDPPSASSSSASQPTSSPSSVETASSPPATTSAPSPLETSPPASSTAPTHPSKPPSITNTFPTMKPRPTATPPVTAKPTPSTPTPTATASKPIDKAEVL